MIYLCQISRDEGDVVGYSVDIILPFKTAISTWMMLPTIPSTNTPAAEEADSTGNLQNIGTGRSVRWSPEVSVQNFTSQAYYRATSSCYVDIRVAKLFHMVYLVSLAFENCA